MLYERKKEEILKRKIIHQNKNEDFVSFWEEQIGMLRQKPVKYTREKIKTPYDKAFDSYDIFFNTHDDTIVHASYSVPFHKEGEKLPCVAYFHGGGGKGPIIPNVLATGVCCFAIDVRSQGGQSADKAVYEVEDVYSGLMTKGVTDPNSFYMRNIYLDAVRTMDVIAELPEVDLDRIVTFGMSQGGALSIVASALSGHSVKCFASEPSFACIWERIEAGSGVFGAVKTFVRIRPELVDDVFDCVTYFDVNNMASLLNCPADLCLGLEDPICLPEFVYSVYTHIEAEKKLMMVPFAQHHPVDNYYAHFIQELSEL